MPEDLTREDEEESPKSWLKIGGCAALAIWSCNFIAGLVFAFRGDAQPLASFADSFAIVNALFSSVAVVGAVYAVILQQKELALTRAEMRQAREAHEDSADAQERMTVIQGYSTILAGVTGDLTQLWSRLDQVRELKIETEKFHRENEDELGGHGLARHTFADVKLFFHRAELLTLWKSREYAKYEIATQIAIDFLKLEPLLNSEHESLVQELTELHARKKDVIKLLEGSMKSRRHPKLSQ